VDKQRQAGRAFGEAHEADFTHSHIDRKVIVEANQGKRGVFKRA